MLSSSHANRSPSGTGSSFHRSSPSNTLAYWLVKCSLFTDDWMTSWISIWVGQMSLRNTLRPSTVPMGSL